jgi:hypothetical protein
MVKNNTIQGNTLIEETIDVMDVNKLKQDIIDRIQRTDDVETLKELIVVLKYHAIPKVGDEFTEEQLKLLDEAEGQIERGECSTNEEVNREIGEWFKKG